MLHATCVNDRGPSGLIFHVIQFWNISRDTSNAVTLFAIVQSLHTFLFVQVVFLSLEIDLDS